MNPTILITGGLGYVGCHLAYRLLLNGGFAVWIVDNAGTDAVIAERKAVLTKMAKELCVELRISALNFVTIKAWQLTSVKYVIHLAAEAERGMRAGKEDLFSCIENNTCNTLKLVGKVFKAPVAGFIFASTGIGVGGRNNGGANESILPPFQQSKISCEHLFQSLLNRQDRQGSNVKCKIVCLRLWTIIGCNASFPCFADRMTERNGTKMVPRLLSSLTSSKVYEFHNDDDDDEEEEDGMVMDATVDGNNYNSKDGSMECTFVDVADAVEAFMCSINYITESTLSSFCHVFDVGGKGDVTQQELYGLIEKELRRRVGKVQVNYIYGPRLRTDAEASVCSGERIKETYAHLNWLPLTPMEKTVEDIVDTWISSI